MKNSLYIIVFLGILSNGNAQCVPTIINSDPNQAVCSDQWFPNNSTYYNTGVIKINMDYLVYKGNTYTFSTVGETLGDTYLSLYDSNGNLLSYNDDAAGCNCKQSTLIYNPPDDVNSRTNFYLILSKPGCSPLDFDVKIKYNVRNTYDGSPYVSSPLIAVPLCAGEQKKFGAGNYTPNTWHSYDTTIATIDQSTGMATFLKEGVAKIGVSLLPSCIIINNYLVHIAKTSPITPN